MSLLMSEMGQLPWCPPRTTKAATACMAATGLGSQHVQAQAWTGVCVRLCVWLGWGARVSGPCSVCL